MNKLNFVVYIESDDDFYFEGINYEFNFMKFNNMEEFICWIWKNMSRLRVKYCGSFFTDTLRTDFSCWGDRFSDVLKMFDKVSKHKNKKNHIIRFGNWYIKWETNKG
jgi:hypothetical protein